MKKVTILSFAIILFSISIISLCIKQNNNPGKPIYLPKRSAEITQTVQQYLLDYVPDGNVILMFYAEWCGPCRRMCPLIDNLAELLLQFTFLKINRDDFKDLAHVYGITSIPTLIFLHNGKEIGRYEGKPLTQEKLGKLIKKVYAKI